jgi:hypothetical protein
MPAARARSAAEPADLIFQLGPEVAALLRVREEKAAQLRVLCCLGRGAEALFPIATCRDEPVERRDDVLVTDRHGSRPPEVEGALPRKRPLLE